VVCYVDISLAHKISNIITQDCLLLVNSTTIMIMLDIPQPCNLYQGDTAYSKASIRSMRSSESMARIFRPYLYVDITATTSFSE
jgi:hypothetical protein